MASAPAAPPSRHDPYAALRHASFRWFFVGGLLSAMGSQARTVAVGWDVYARTGSALSLGGVGLALALPVLLLALPAGALADRHSRKGLVILGQIGTALSGLGLAWASHVHAPMAVVYALLVATATSRAIGWPASQALVPGLVPPEHFASAATWRSLYWQAAATTGPLLAGVVIARAGAVPLYLFDAAAAVAFVLCLAQTRPRPVERPAEARSWRSLLDGARFVRSQPLILSTITLDMVAVLFGGATALLPVFARDVLHVGPVGFGWLRAMPSLGAVVMGGIQALAPPMRRSGRALLWAVAAFGVATIVFGTSRSFPLSLAALFVLGAADNVSVIIRGTLLQLLTPDSMRGRVAAVNAVFIGTSNEIGEFESGLTAHWWGATRAVLVGGIGTLVVVAAAAAKWPELRALGRLVDLRPPDDPVAAVAPRTQTAAPPRRQGDR